MKNLRIPRVSWLFLLIILTIGCDDAFTPRPWGYFRIDLPEKTYRTFESDCPFSFEYPEYSVVVEHRSRTSMPCWYNLEFPEFQGRLYLTYHAILKQGEINENKAPVEKYQEDARKFAMGHSVKASAIDEELIANKEESIYGIVYHIKGMNTASSLQFYLTDSTDHFFRGALYFDTAPQNDSLAPVIDFITEDVFRFIETFKWETSVPEA
ncbi:MAG TPA: gliding motility lipoprotein GldD [Flavobacteriales bacterium]|nr:gliding motility lipoprotein GldD [Flavobacteriales bacterium]HIO67476.1 gliding motility lipoprotein GldD [Flavobacteriales bacterium]